MTDWLVFVDGASSGNPGSSGAGMVVFNALGQELFRQSTYLGEMTNNMAEYEAFIRALRHARAENIDNITIYTDSQLLANQISGVYQTKNVRLRRYLEEARLLIRTFGQFRIHHIPREQNGIADSLAKAAVKGKGRRVVAGIKPEESPGIAGQDGP
jgi:ribonuclease HI